MQTYDMLMLLVLIAAAMWGALKGFAWQLASIASVVASYFVAYNFRDQVATMIEMDPPLNIFAAMLILFVGTSLVIWFGFRLLKDFIEKFKLQGFDRQLGAALGLAKGGIFCLIITFFAVTLLGEQQRRTIVLSRSGFYIAKFLDQSEAIIPKELHAVLEPYISRLDERLNQPPSIEPNSPGTQPSYQPVMQPGYPAGTYGNEPPLPNTTPYVGAQPQGYNVQPYGQNGGQPSSGNSGITEQLRNQMLEGLSDQILGSGGNDTRYQ